jgi:flavin reductase (DIM6/NTAB) family NADH-FMN oxidoreductase RutF
VHSRRPLAVSEQFTRLVACADPAMVIVTTAAGDERGGCLVGFHAQSSIDPERYSLWLSKANHTYRLALRASHLAIHFLATDDTDLAAHFGTLTGDDVDKFERLTFDLRAGGVPVLRQIPNWFVTRKVALLDEGGDHVCISTEPVEAHAGGTYAPLRLSMVDHLQPGHGNQERHSPPTERAAV